MIIYNFLLISNPIFDAYFASDFFGKAVFWGLLLLSLLSWNLIVYKVWLLRQAKRSSLSFYALFVGQRDQPLAITMELPGGEPPNNPFLQLYALSKKQCLELLAKNKRAAPLNEGPFLSASDVELLAAHLANGIATLRRQLEGNLFVLATVVSLGPFLGLLGTVWGILTTFSHLQQGAAGLNQAILGGIAMALGTTVVGLLVAIPALLGYSWLRNSLRAFSNEMECFANELLATIELQYRLVEKP